MNNAEINGGLVSRRSSEFMYFPRSTASLSKLSTCFRHGYVRLNPKVSFSFFLCLILKLLIYLITAHQHTGNYFHVLCFVFVGIVMKRAKACIPPGAEARWIDQLSDEEFYCELHSAVQETGVRKILYIYICILLTAFLYAVMYF